MTSTTKDVLHALAERGVAQDDIAAVAERLDAEQRQAPGDFHARRDAEAAQAQAAYTEWQRAAIAEALATADPAGELRAAFDQTGAAWRDAADMQQRLTAELDQVNAQRPTSSTAIVAQIKRRNEILNELDALAAQLPALEAVHQTATEALESALARAVAVRYRAAEQAARQLKADMDRQLQAAADAAQRWSSLRRKVERGQAGALLSTI